MLNLFLNFDLIQNNICYRHYTLSSPHPSTVLLKRNLIVVALTLRNQTASLQ